MEIKNNLFRSSTGNSKIEKLAAKIEDRRANRIKIPFEIRVHFLEVCSEIARKSGHDNRMTLEDFNKLREEVQNRMVRENKPPTDSMARFFKETVLGIWDRDATMLRLLDKAHSNIREVGAHWFWFRDFNFYFTVCFQMACSGMCSTWC